MIWRVAVVFGAMLLLISGMLSIVRQKPSEAYWVTFAVANDDRTRWQLYRTWPDDHATTHLVSDKKFPDLPVMSPDASQIAYADGGLDNNGQIRTIRAGSSNTHLIYSGPHDVGVYNWSPDGQWIIFGAYDGRRWTTYVMTTDGSNINEIGSQSGWNARSVEWSPDSQWITFGAQVDEENWALFRVRPDGSNLAQLTEPGLAISSTAWSPDGEWIAFARLEFTQDGVDAFNFGRIYRIRADGTQLEQISPESISSVSANWSPDGQWLAVGISANLTSGIYRLRADGSDHQPISTGGDAWSAIWSPDGRWIFFQGSSFDGEQVFRSRPDGKETTQLTDGLQDAYNLQVSSLIDLPFFGGRLLALGSGLVLATVMMWVIKGRLKPAATTML